MIDVAQIPRDLRERPQWLLWRFEPGVKKPRKVPYYADGRRRYGAQGDDRDRSRLVTLDQALAAAKRQPKMEFAGVGFAFLPGDGLIGIDVDKCINLETGEVSQLALDIIAGCKSYTEYSPSGTGVHVIVSGETKTFKDNGVGVEVFCGSQFFTFSARLWSGAPTTIEPIEQKTLDWLYGIVRNKPTSAGADRSAARSPAPPAQANARAKLESALAYVPADDYHVWIKIGMGLFSALGPGGFSVWDYWSSKSEGYDGSEACRKHWDSFARVTDVTEATIYYHAQKHGWRPPRSATPPPVTPKSPAPPGEASPVLSPPAPLAEDNASGAQAPRGEREEQYQAGPEGPDNEAAEADAHTDAPPAHFDDVPPGETPDFFDEGGGEQKPKPKKVYGPGHWDRVNYVLDNFILIYGEDLVWDAQHRLLMKVGSMRTIVANGDVMKFWSGEARKWVLKKNIKFDPAETPSPAESGPTATINLFNGWKMKPKQGDCIQVLALLLHLCDADEDIMLWVLRWLAYPLRNPGAKMDSSIIMHGDEGSGKNFFFERIVKRIYGEYGYVIGNAQLESQFNDWASRKLFMIADEVVTRAELRLMKGRLKGLITGETIVINPKGLPEHSEENHMNFVFLSNELIPLALDKTDRRYLVLWTPPALPKEFYVDLGDQLNNGVIEAFHYYLMHEVDMGDFNAHTKPLYTDAKDSLIEKSLSPPERFYREWSAGFLPLPFITCASEQLYAAYKIWCERSGESKYISLTLFSPTVLRYAGTAITKKLIEYEFGKAVKQRTVFLVGEQPENKKTFAAWCEDACAMFEESLKTYRTRGGGNMDT